MDPMREMSLQDEMLAELSEFTQSKKIVIYQTSDSWFDLLNARFPKTIIGALAWEEVPGHQSCGDVVPIIPPEGINGEEVVQRNASKIAEFLERFAANGGIGHSDQVVIIGDGVTEVALGMSFETLFKVFMVLFSYPQHTYVLTSDGVWCFVFTFEFFMHFGKSPKMSNSLSLSLLSLPETPSEGNGDAK